MAALVVGVLAASALCSGAAAARPTKQGRYSTRISASSGGGGGNIAAAAASVGETQDVYHYCDM